MKESYRKRVANHPDPEPCEGGGNDAREAVPVARPLRPRELFPLPVRDTNLYDIAPGGRRALVAVPEP
ncbi:MAG TPA: hypothetical protein VGS58_12480, partial [Candidatus Sulfopaludibacter sp.]|nr:hypothetical protein [Candidatus Sulfopaludibacter sp.]